MRHHQSLVQYRVCLEARLTEPADNWHTEPCQLNAVEKCVISKAASENMKSGSGDDARLQNLQEVYAIHEELVAHRVAWKSEEVDIFQTR